MLQDFRFGLRMLRNSPGFSILAVLCLTLGIGGNAAVFSWIEGILLRPYPLVHGQDRLFAIAGTDRANTGPNGLSWPDLQDLSRSTTLVEAFIVEKITGTTLSIGDRAERAAGGIVSANYFDALGVRPILGRGFLPDETVGRNAHPVVVISYQMWKDRFHGDPAIVGKTQILNGLPFTIVGVAPENFFGLFIGYAFQFWVPASMQPQFDGGVYKLEDRSARWVEGYVRLKPGVSTAQAQTELGAIAQRLETNFPATNRGRGVKLFPLWQTPFNGASEMMPLLAISLAVVIAVLLIACANVGNLLLLRAFVRQQEMTIRVAIGAGRGRLVRQLLTEGIVLSALGAAGGLLVARWLRNALALLIPPRGGVALRFPGELDWRVVALSAAACLVATLIFALVPAILASHVDVATALRAQSGAVVGGRGRAWVRSGLVVLQISLSFVLLTGATLLIESVRAIRNADPGFSTDRVLVTAVDLFAAGYDQPRARVFQDELMDRVRRLGGIESGAYSRTTPFSYREYSSAPIAVDGVVPPPDQQPTAEYNEVSEGYLATMGIPLVAGREFTRADDENGAPVAIVDETTAAQYWPGDNPVGRRVRLGGQWRQIVGLARTAKYHNLLEPRKPFLYVPLRQAFSPQVTLELRTRQPPEAVSAALVREIHALDANIAPSELITMHEQVDRTTASQHVAVTVLVLFGGVALILAGIGLYGVMASSVSQARRELALRSALGAAAADLLRLVASRGAALTGIGLAVGLVAAFELTRLLGYLLYGVNPRDPFAFSSASIGIVVVSLAASLVPAIRATCADPVEALRS